MLKIFFWILKVNLPIKKLFARANRDVSRVHAEVRSGVLIQLVNIESRCFNHAYETRKVLDLIRMLSNNSQNEGANQYDRAHVVHLLNERGTKPFISTVRNFGMFGVKLCSLIGARRKGN